MSNKYKIQKKIISIIIIVAFISTTIGTDVLVSTAWGQPAAASNNNDATFLSESPLFYLPRSFGEIRDSWSPEKGEVYKKRPAIIHIQDAHCNYDAQKRIGDIIEYFNREYAITSVNLEGGTRDYDLSIFTRNMSKNRTKMSDDLLKEGVINGAEYFAVNNPGKVSLWGVEDVDLYLKNLEAYRDVIKHKEEIDSCLVKIKNIITDLKTSIYSKDLLLLDSISIDYREERVTLKDYINTIAGKANKLDIDIARFENIDILFRAIKKEDDVDFKKADKERDLLIDALYEKLSDLELEELVVKTISFKEERITPEEFYGYLIGKSRTTSIDPDKFRELEKYLKYISEYGEMDISVIMAEIEDLTSEIKEKLFKNDEERKLDDLSGNLGILKDFFNVTLTRSDYNHYLGNKREFTGRYIKETVLSLMEFSEKSKEISSTSSLSDASIYSSSVDISPRLSLSGLTGQSRRKSARQRRIRLRRKILGSSPRMTGKDEYLKLDKYIAQMENFYKYSFKRDKVFLENLRFNEVRGTGEKVAILITGGFHSDNLYNLFKEKGISYVSIIPEFKNEEGYVSPYFDLLSGKSNGILKFIEPAVSMLSMYSYLCGKYSNEVHGASFSDLNYSLEKLLKGDDEAVVLPGGKLKVVLSESRPEGGDEIAFKVSDNRKLWIVTNHVSKSIVREPKSGAWIDDPAYIIFAAWWLEPLLSYGLADMLYSGDAVTAVISGAIFWGIHIVRAITEKIKYGTPIFGKGSILFDRGIITLAIMTAIAGLPLYLAGSWSASAIASFLLLTAFHLGINLSSPEKKNYSDLKDIMKGVSEIEGVTNVRLKADSGGHAYVFSGKYNGRPVIIKRTRSLEHEKFVRNEFDVLNELNGDHLRNDIVKPYGLLRDKYGASCLILEDVDGSTIRRKDYSEKSTKEKVDFMIEVAKALEYIHHKGVSYKDLHPSNIMIRKDGSICLIDFGISISKGYDHAEDPLGIVAYVRDEYDSMPFLSEQTLHEGNRNTIDINLFGFFIMDLEVGEEAFEEYHSIRAGKYGAFIDEEMYSTLQDTEGRITPALKELILKCINRPQDYSDFSEILLVLEEIRTEMLSGRSSGLALIGKLLDKEGNVVESITSAKEIKDKNLLEIKVENKDAEDAKDKNAIIVKIPFYSEGEKTLTFESDDIRAKLDSLRDVEDIPDHINDIVNDLIEKIGPDVKKVIALSDHETVKGAFGQDAFGENVLFLDHKLIDNPLALLHELGEGYARVPYGYEDMTRHTFMRGAGKDVRRAYQELSAVNEEVLNTLSESDFIGYLEGALRRLDKVHNVSKNRAPPEGVDRADHTYLTSSELALIKWNYSHGITGIKSLFGIQDHLSYDENLTLISRITKPKNIIDRKDISSGRRFADIVKRISIEPVFVREDIPVYAKVLYSGFSVLSGYFEYLNDEGLILREEFSRYIEQYESGEINWEKDFTDFKHMAAKIPTIDKPNDDLFVDIDLTDEQFDILLHKGYKGFLNVQMTGGACPNQCAICGVGKVKGAPVHMPFPLIAKILRKAKDKQKILMPYFKSDPVSYHDNVINATLGDVIRFAENVCGFDNVIVTSHGLPGKGNRGKLKGVMDTIDVKTGISFHVYHSGVIDNIIRQYDMDKGRALFDAQEIKDERKQLMDSYRERYVNMIGGLIRKGTAFNIILYKPYFERDPDGMITRKYPASAEVLRRMLEFQDELFSKVRDDIYTNTGVDLRKIALASSRVEYDDINAKYITPTHITWIADAINLLKHLVEKVDNVDFGMEISEKTFFLDDDELTDEAIEFRNLIVAIQEEALKDQKETVVESKVSIILRPEHTESGEDTVYKIILQTKEGMDQVSRFRTVTDMFGGEDVAGQSHDVLVSPDRFLTFLRYVQLLHSINEVKKRSHFQDDYLFLGVTRKYRNLPEEIQQDIRKALYSSAGSFINEEREEGRTVTTDDFFADVKLSISGEINEYYSIISNFFIDNERFDELLEDTEANIYELYELLKDVPFPVIFSGITAFRQPSYNARNFVNFSNSSRKMDKDLLHSFHEFISPVKVFKDSPVKGTGLIGKFLNRDGNVVESIMSAKEAIDRKTLEITAENADPVRIPFYLEKGKTLTVGADDIRGKLERLLNAGEIPGHIKDIASGLIEKIGPEVKKVIALSDHETVKGAFGQDSSGENVLFLNHKLIDDPLALFHELGEGFTDIPEGYEGLSRHTFMRGVGKDLRRAYDKLSSGLGEGVLAGKPEGEVMTLLEAELAKMDIDGKISRNRAPPEKVDVSAHTYITPSELLLVKWNYAHDQTGRKALFGIQDHLSHTDNIELSGKISISKKKGYRLAQMVTVMKMIKDRGGRAEEDYRSMDMQALFNEDKNRYPSDSEIRLDTYMTHQAAESGQAIIELLANAQDASTPGKKKVGRFGVGGYQVLGELVDEKGRDIPGAKVVLESSKDGVNGARFTFYREFGDTLFDYEVFSNGEIKKGTKIKALKKLNPVEIHDRKRFVSKKVRVNTRGAIKWSGTEELLNTPEDYKFLNGVERYDLPPEREVPAVYVNINEDGYEVSDSGTGMGFKDIVERFLIPKSGDKPLTGETDIEIAEEIRMFYKPDNADSGGSLISLFVNDYEIEGHPADDRLNIIKEMVLSFPHDTVLTEDRGVLNIGTSPSLAIEGMKLMIDKLVDMKKDVPNRIGVINTLALILKKKQPKEEGGLIQESYEKSTDLLWYLRSKLNEHGGVLDRYRSEGTRFLPNSREWEPFFDSSGKRDIALLDADLFEFDPANSDIFYDITDNEIFSRLKDRGVRIYSAAFLNVSEGTASIVKEDYNSQEIVIIDRDIYDRERNMPEVLLKRINAAIESKTKESAYGRESGGNGSMRRIWRSLISGRFRKITAVLLIASALLYGMMGIIKRSPESEQYYYDVDPPEYTVSAEINESDIVEITVPDDRMTVSPSSGVMTVEKPYRSMTMPPQMYSGRGASRYRYSYGSISGDTDNPLIKKVYPHMDAGGNWSEDRDLKFIETSDTNPAVEEVSVYINVSPSTGIDPYERIDGDITNVRLLRNNGGSVPVIEKHGMFYPDNYTGPAWFSYDIDIDSGNRSLEYEERPLPRNEIDNMPEIWKEVLDPFRGEDVPEYRKREAVEYLMARDFAYNGQTKVFMRDTVSWTHSARAILEEKIVPKKFIEHFFGGYVLQHLIHNGWVDEINKDEVKVRNEEDRESYTLDLTPENIESLEEFLKTGKIPVICNTSALYDYIFSRYVGLKAVYVTIERSENNKLYKNLVGHAMTLTRVNGVWRMNETTGYMPEIYPAVDWVGVKNEGRSSGGDIKKSDLYEIYSRTIGRDSWIERNIRNINFILALFIGFIGHGVLLALVSFGSLINKGIQKMIFTARSKTITGGKEIFTFFRSLRSEKIITFLELWYRKMGGSARKSIFDKSFMIGNDDLVSISNNISARLGHEVVVTFESNPGNNWNFVPTGFSDMRELSPASAGENLYIFKEGYTYLKKPEVSVVRRGSDRETVLHPEKVTGKYKNMKDTFVFIGSLYCHYADRSSEDIVKFDGGKISPVLVPRDKKEKIKKVRRIRQSSDEIMFAGHVRREGADILRIYRAYKDGREETDDILLEGDGDLIGWDIKVTDEGISAMYTKGGKVYTFDREGDADLKFYLTDLRVNRKGEVLKESSYGTTSVIADSHEDTVWYTRGNILVIITGPEGRKSLISCTKTAERGSVGRVDTAVFITPSIKKVRMEYSLSDEHVFEIINEYNDIKYVHCSAEGMWISDGMGHDHDGIAFLGKRDGVDFYAYKGVDVDRNRIVAVKDNKEIFNYYSAELFLLDYKEPFAPVIYDNRIYILLYEQGDGLLHLIEISDEESRAIAIDYSFTSEAPRTLSRVCSDITGVPSPAFIPFDSELKEKVDSLRDMETEKNRKISWRETGLFGSEDKIRAEAEEEISRYKHKNEIGNDILSSMAEHGVPVEINEYVTGLQNDDKFYINGKEYPLFSYEDLTSEEKSYRERRIKEDEAYISRLDEEAKEAFSLRAGRIKRWHLSFLFMDKWIDYFEERIPDDVLDYMDKYLVKPNISKQDELRKTMDLISKLYLLDIPDASIIVMNYLTLADNMPDIEGDVREALLRKWDIEGFPSTIRGINLFSEKDKWDRLPTNLSFFLKYLSGDISSALKEEELSSIPGNPVNILDAGGESLSKLLAFLKMVSKDEVANMGLGGVARKYKEFPDKEYDKSDIKGAVNAQERVLPVWIRELVQNSRDAIREADAGEEELKHRDINIRSYTNDGKWIVSVEDGLGMNIERLLKILLVPDATTKTLENDVMEILKLRKNRKETVDELIGKLFKPEFRNEVSIYDDLLSMFETKPDETKLSRMIVSKFQEKLIKTSGGFFGQGFFTVFSDADEVFVRSGKEGKVHEISLIPVHDKVSGEVVDIRVNRIEEYDDPQGEYQGTEVRRIKNITTEKRGETEIENAYLNYQAIKMIGGISEYNIYWNGDKISDEMEEAAHEDGVEIRLSRSAIKRISIDQLYVQELIPEILEYIPDYIVKKLIAEGLNVDFEKGTPPVRTRNAVRNPSGYRPRLAVLALKTAGYLYKKGRIDLEYLPGHNSYMRRPLYDDHPVTREMKDDAEYLMSGKYLDDPESDIFWKRFQRDYLNNSRAWQNLMLMMDTDLYVEKHRMYTEGIPRDVIANFNNLIKEGITIKMPGLTASPEDREEVRKELLFNHIKLYAELFVENKVEIGGNRLEEFLNNAALLEKRSELSELAEKIIRDEPGWVEEINDNNWKEAALYLPLESLNMSAIDLINRSAGSVRGEGGDVSAVLRGAGVDPEFSNRNEIKALSAVMEEFSELLGIKVHSGMDDNVRKKVSIDIRDGIIDSFLDFIETGNVGGLIDHYVSAVFNGDGRAYIDFYDTWLRGNLDRERIRRLITEISDISEIKTRSENLKVKMMETKYPMAIVIEVKEDSPFRMEKDMRMVSLIGKLVDKNGSIVDRIISAGQLTGENILEITSENIRPLKIPFYLQKGETLIFESHTITDKLNSLVDKNDLPDSIKTVVDGLIAKIGREVKRVIALDDHETVKGAFGRDESGESVLFLNYRLIDNPLALLHELGEGYVEVPEKYESMTRHTFMRGAGADVREALDILIDKGMNFDDPEDLVSAVDSELEKMDKLADRKLSETRIKHNKDNGTYVTESERSLIRWNFNNNNEKGRRVLFGVQDWIDPDGNIRFTEQIRLLTGDLRRSTLNLFLIPETDSVPEAGSKMFTVHKKIERKFRKKRGINTHIMSFKQEFDAEEFREKLEYMLDIAISGENSSFLPKVCVDCPTKEHVEAVNSFITEKRKMYEDIDIADIFGIINDPLEKGDIADEVKIVMVGSALMDDRRLKKIYEGSLDDEYFRERRARMIKFFVENNIMEDGFDYNDAGELDKIIDDIWRGTRYLHITKINWETIRDWKSSQDAIMRSL